MLKERIAARADRLLRRLSSVDPGFVSEIRRVIEQHAGELVEHFYAALLATDEARPFLTHELVESHLKHALRGWLVGIIPPDGSDLTAVVERQYEVGRVHARINLPLHLLSTGVRLVRRDLGELVTRAGWDRQRTLDAVFWIGELFDMHMECVEDAFLDGLTVNTRNQQTLQSVLARESLALECERQKSLLYDWERRVVMALYEGRFSRAPLDPAEGDFARWLSHRAPLALGDAPEMDALRDGLSSLRQAYRGAGDRWDAAEAAERSALAHALRRGVNELSALLGLLSERAVAGQSVRDPLTRLLGRRHLAPILEREIALFRRSGRTFAIVLLDVDRFKDVNDAWGHAAGDAVLRTVAEVLEAGIRSGDFAFRYGGEEFLVVLTEIALEAAAIRADALRSAIAECRIALPGRSEPVQITASVGVALYDGHPDFERLIRSVDRALYEAKAAGRNCTVTASPSSERVES